MKMTAKQESTKQTKDRLSNGKKLGGRPPVTLENLPKDWKEKVLLMSAQGMSAVEIRASMCLTGRGKTLKFHQNTWDALQTRDEEFLLTIKIGKDLCQAWWEAQGRKSLKAKNFQTGLWYANMKNRFGWKDKHEIEGGGDTYLTTIINMAKENEDAGPGTRIRDFASILSAGNKR